MNNHSSTIAEYVDASDSSQSRINYYTLEAGRYFYLSRNCISKGASAAPEFSARQLCSPESDKEWRTAHAPGIGDALKLEITKPAHIDQVGIISGCGATEQEWYRHTRIREVQVSVNGRYTRNAVLPDEYTFPWTESHKAYQWIDLPPYPGNAEQIQLVIRGVYPGSSDQVTCVNKVMLRQWMKSKPSVKSGIDRHELP